MMKFSWPLVIYSPLQTSPWQSEITLLPFRGAAPLGEDANSESKIVVRGLSRSFCGGWEAFVKGDLAYDIVAFLKVKVK
jgi:hypothetical protein